MSEPKYKHVRYDAQEKRWVSEPFRFLPRVRHKPVRRRRMTRDGLRATIGGIR